jgi:hypothetical protein
VRQWLPGKSDSERCEFLVLLRSLSIFHEQQQSKFTSVYVQEFVPKELKPADSFSSVNAFGSSMPIGAITNRVKKTKSKDGASKPPVRTSPKASEVPPISRKPVGNPDLLKQAGLPYAPNSRYRDDFKQIRETYPSVIPKHFPVSARKGAVLTLEVSTSLGSILPINAAPSACREEVGVSLPMQRQSRTMLRDYRPMAQRSGHLLWRDGVVFDGEGNARHDVGELSIYRMEYAAKNTTVKPAEPTIDPFACGEGGGGTDIASKLFDEHVDDEPF